MLPYLLAGKVMSFAQGVSSFFLGNAISYGRWPKSCLDLVLNFVRPFWIKVPLVYGQGPSLAAKYD
jgi:hypothetical protein